MNKHEYEAITVALAKAEHISRKYNVPGFPLARQMIERELLRLNPDFNIKKFRKHYEKMVEAYNVYNNRMD